MKAVKEADPGAVVEVCPWILKPCTPFGVA
jgi:hypothetical protein